MVVLCSKKGGFRLDLKNFESSETLSQVAQISGRCPISVKIVSQIKWGSEQPDLVDDVHA